MQEAAGLPGGEGSSLVRLHVGGLGPAVISSDLLQTFSSLVHVTSVEVVRTKGRNFAYVTIQADPQDIKRLFSLYNGCMWKGGRLKLEKAREFYMDKLHHEWAERDHLQDSNISLPDAETPSRIAPKFKESSGFNIYFPKLRKVKKIPEKGLGKHKRSFERVEPLPHALLRICNCNQDCMATCRSQSLKAKEPLRRDKEEERRQGGANKKLTNEATSKSQLSYKESGKKGRKVYERKPIGGYERGSEKISGFEYPFLNIKDGSSHVKTDIAECISDLDEPVLNITGSKSNVVQTEQSTDQEFHKEDAQAMVDGAQMKRLKAELNPLGRKERRVNSEIDKGKGQMLQTGQMDGSNSSTSSLAGRSWVQKASWKALVGETGQMPFSLGSVLDQSNCVAHQ